MYEPYEHAIRKGQEIAQFWGDFTMDKATYWAVRHSARHVAGCMLTKATEIGVTPEQWEELRKVAAEEAPD